MKRGPRCSAGTKVLKSYVMTSFFHILKGYSVCIFAPTPTPTRVASYPTVRRVQCCVIALYDIHGVSSLG
eukprot:6928416-Prorocentrum_lima.AAC.1